ncbi:MAG: hypothetical protein D4R79_13645 [Comamonadaceae bacterium]|nr:MAG: hypothetical protein D4R79_13645 [Comamonadaceae bacterium]
MPGVDELTGTGNMTIDWDKLKGATLDDKALDGLKTAFDELGAQRDAARKESIDGRKGKDAKIKELTDAQDKLFERLGISAVDELDSLPDAKGQADALKQFEGKIKRLERERDEGAAARKEIEGKYTAERRERAIAQAIAKHQFIDADDARALVGMRVRQEGDDFLFDAGDGKLTSIEDGAAWMAKTKTHLVRAAGDGGSGSGFRPAGQGHQGAKTMTRAAFDVASHVERTAFAKEGGQVVDN